MDAFKYNVDTRDFVESIYAKSKIIWSHWKCQKMNLQLNATIAKNMDIVVKNATISKQLHRLWNDATLVHWTVTSVGARRVACALEHSGQDWHTAVCAQEHQPQGVQETAATGKILHILMISRFSSNKKDTKIFKFRMLWHTLQKNVYTYVLKRSFPHLSSSDCLSDGSTRQPLQCVAYILRNWYESTQRWFSGEALAVKGSGKTGKNKYIVDEKKFSLCWMDVLMKRMGFHFWA